ncbi:MAG: hypothetical protein Q9157_005339 [Trypethelium eluteriae]
MSSPSSPSGGARVYVMDLVRDTIERDYPDWQKQSEEQSKLAPDAMGWTIDLSHHDIRILPEEVVHILADNVRRLAIGHNRLVSIPTCLANCQNLRYFNARNNDIHVFPGALLQMPNLEIIDLSDNKMVGIPDAIEGMPALNALAIASNKIERLPSCLWRMKKLRMIKVHGNPLQYPPAQILEVNPDLFDPKVPNAYEMAMTARVKEWLYNKHKEKMAKMRVDLSPGRTRPAALDIAKASRRAHGTRFPVKPSLSGISIDHSVEAEEKTSASSTGRAIHDTVGAKLGPPARSVSFETPDPASTPVNAPPIPPRSESRVHSQSTSVSPEGTAASSSHRPRLATLAPDSRGDRSTASASPDNTKVIFERLGRDRGENLDGMARSILDYWVVCAKSVSIVRDNANEWYNQDDDSQGLGDALKALSESVSNTRLHLTGYYDFHKDTIEDYVNDPTTETINIKFPIRDTEQWATDLGNCRRKMESHFNKLLPKVASYAVALRLLPPPGGDPARCARAELVDQIAKLTLQARWEGGSKERNRNPLVDTLSRIRLAPADASIAGPAIPTPIIPQPPANTFIDQDNPFAPVYDKMIETVAVLYQISERYKPDEQKMPAWRTVKACMGLFNTLHPRGDSEHLRNVTWRLTHAFKDFVNEGITAGEGRFIREFLGPNDMIMETVRLFSLTGFTGK